MEIASTAYNSPLFSAENDAQNDWIDRCYGQCHYAEFIHLEPGTPLGGPQLHQHGIFSVQALERQPVVQPIFNLRPRILECSNHLPKLRFFRMKEKAGTTVWSMETK